MRNHYIKEKKINKKVVKHALMTGALCAIVGGSFLSNQFLYNPMSFEHKQSRSEEQVNNSTRENILNALDSANRITHVNVPVDDFLYTIKHNQPKYSIAPFWHKQIREKQINKLVEKYISNVLEGHHKVPHGSISVDDVKYTIEHSTDTELREMRKLGF